MKPDGEGARIGAGILPHDLVCYALVPVRLCARRQDVEPECIMNPEGQREEKNERTRHVISADQKPRMQTERHMEQEREGAVEGRKMMA